MQINTGSGPLFLEQAELAYILDAVSGYHYSPIKDKKTQELSGALLPDEQVPPMIDKLNKAMKTP